MFKSLWDKIVAFVKEAKAVVKAVWNYAYSDNALPAGSLDVVPPKSNKDFEWIKWFKGEYRTNNTLFVYDMGRGLMASFIGTFIVGVAASKLLAPFLGIAGLIIGLLIGCVAGRFAQAIDLKLQMDRSEGRDLFA